MALNDTRRVLVVEDERIISDAVTYALRREGYETRAVFDGAQTETQIRAFQPDVIVLDVMLPGMDGYTILRGLPLERHYGVILVTARDDITDKILGLELGADDYLTKPFDMRELLARVRSLYRRLATAPVPVEEPEIIWGNIVLNQVQREARVSDEIVTLTPKEFDLAVMLLSNPGRVYTREQLLESVWGFDYLGATRTVDIHIQRLRKKFAAAHGEVNETESAVTEVFHTVHGVGYKARRAYP
ncbi:response regulator transcription factor [Populibacterium corticicola]|uniref:Response regulator transcription factor n=1 Tax=Populibacterium corticicola TaxID=1812826 RepID=A0ABW5XFS3_9MICO